MQRDLRRLADTRFDLIVVGGGFYGAVAAWDATLRGLSVALIDQGDFGGATSFNNLKTLHGGLRSLQSLNLLQMRLFVRERRALARVAPHLVRPLPFVVPTYRHPLRHRALLDVALRINDLVAHDRSDGIADPALHLPAGRTISRDECLALSPHVDPDGVTGGGVWFDYQMRNTDRMTFSFVASAADRGAEVANYARAGSLIWEHDRVTGVRVEDRLTATTFDVRGHAVLNATGPWASMLVESLGVPGTKAAPALSRAMNVIVRRQTGSHACGGLARGRYLFLVPWRTVTLVGTSHDSYSGRPEALTVTRRDLEAFIADARRAFPRADLGVSDISLVHRGLLPMVSGDESHISLLKESVVIDHARDRAPGFFSIFSVRYTTARATAAAAIDAVFRSRGVAVVPASTTDTTPVIGGALSNIEGFVADVVAQHPHVGHPEDRRRIALTYGTASSRIFALAESHPDLARRLSPDCGVIGAEIVHAARAEWAIHLTDALLRRTETGSAGHPGEPALTRAAALMAEELGWSERQHTAEIEAARAFFRLPE